jgi:hypothetical protein
MKRVFSLVGIALSFFVVGCSIHPVPEDVTGIDTYHIVRQIRCETRETLRREIIGWLQRLGTDGHYAFAADLAARYESYPDAISEFRPEIFKGAENANIRSMIKLFYDAGVAYGFELSMTENDDLTAGSATFTRPFIQPVFTLGLGASATMTRSNVRIFAVTDTFGYLLAKLNTNVGGVHYCDDQLKQANYIYPIAGRIGIDRLVHDFIELTLFSNLSETTAVPGSVGAPTMADELTFTTTLGGSANPMVVFTPVTNALQLTNGGFTVGAGRMDIHQVTVGLAIATTEMTDLGLLRSSLFSSSRGASIAARREPSPVLIGNRITGAARTHSEALALQAIDQLRSRELTLVPAR